MNTNTININELDYLALERVVKTTISDYKKSSFRFKGKNFMTPDVLGLIKVGVNNVEISYGRGFSNDWIIGVTCSNYISELSGPVYTIEELEEKLSEIENY